MGTGADLGLEGWLRKLRTFDEAKWRSLTIESLFRELSEAPEDWYAHLQFCEDSYTRNLIGRDKLFELVAIGWLGKQRTPIHDHAGQRCWMWVVHGNLRFQTHRRSGDGFEALGKPDEFGPGHKLYIDDSIGWHSIENPTHKPAVSLHLYARPISECQFFCEESRTIQTHALDTISVV